MDVTEELLSAEGFTDIQYVRAAGGFSAPQMIAKGEVDFGASFAGAVVYHMDAGLPITALAGLHAGCFELFAHEPIRSISDLRGRRVGIQTLSSSGHLYVSVMAKHVGLDPNGTSSGSCRRRQRQGAVRRGRDRRFSWLPARAAGAARPQGRPRDPQHDTDQPWSQYFCCMVYGNREWVRMHPVATKRFLRATFKAADFCSAEPETAARRLVDGGFTERYDYALQTLQEVPYNRWHEYDFGGHDAVLCASALRGRHDRLQPQRDPCRRN